MQVIEISKDKFLSYLLNPNPIFQGQFGKIVLDNNKLYKIYYRDFIKTYINKDECFLDDEVNSLLEIEKLTNFELRNPYKKLNELNRLARTKLASLITGVLSYNGLLVGIQMNYLKNYTTLKEISTRVEDSKLVIYLNKVYELVCNLLMENIVPTDVKEDNILVNEETKDVVLIDLDGSETIYGPDNYLIDFPYNLDIINNNFDKMVNRLKIKKGLSRILKLT
jgi:serine/threonine protein kinase